MKYRTVYHFSAMDEVEKGNTVYCLDKRKRTVYTINDLCLTTALRIIRDAKDDNDRFVFWKEIENA